MQLVFIAGPLDTSLISLQKEKNSCVNAQTGSLLSLKSSLCLLTWGSDTTKIGFIATDTATVPLVIKLCCDSYVNLHVNCVKPTQLSQSH